MAERGGGILKRLSCLLVFLFVLSCAGWSDEPPKYAKIEILHTNDIHGHLLPFDYRGELNVGGVERRATLIRSIKAESKHPVVVMDAGDVYNRGPLARVYFGEPDIEVMNAVPYDIMVLGNGEFRAKSSIDGQNVMFDRIRQAEFPIVCANIVRSDTGDHILPPYEILQVGHLKLGVLGLTAPRIANYPEAIGLEILDPIETARELVPKLKQMSDVIVALTHIGYLLDRELARQVPEIDVIVGGDSHTWLESPVVIQSDSDPHAFWVGGPVIVQAGEWGKSLGRLELHLRRHGSQGYRVMSCSGRLQTVTGDIEPAKDISAILEKYVRPLREVVGYIPEAVSVKEMPEYIARLLQQTFETDAGAHSLSGVHHGLHHGDVTRLDVLSVLSFDNEVVLVEMSPSEFEMLAGNPNVAAYGNSKTGNKTITVALEDFVAANIPFLEGRAQIRTEKKVYDVLLEHISRVPSAYDALDGLSYSPVRSEHALLLR